jgi:bifunctional non-homologous end joining protein LigD
MPLPWRLVTDGLDPKRYTVRTAPKLLAELTPWQGYDDSAAPLMPAIRRLSRRA